MQSTRLPWLALALLTLATSACGRSLPAAVAPAANSPATAFGARPHAADPAPVIPADLRAEVAAARTIIGKPLAFGAPAELDAYLISLTKSLPATAYDPEGFLAGLGLSGVHAPGKQDVDTLEAVRQVAGYKPGTLLDGHEILPQVMAWDIARDHPQTFLDLIRLTNPAVEAPSRWRALWKAPFQPRQKAVPTGETARVRYAKAFGQLPPTALGFDSDFHGGLPKLNDPDPLSYGTYHILTTEGYSDEQARRVATACVGIDHNATPYGDTSPSPTGSMDRHFNLDRQAEDTRFVWARRHLEAAKAFGRAGAFDQAEVELGCGLHSLQDAFAHGQLTPCMHGTIGEFPDQVTYDPVAVVEATEATVLYLRNYLRAL